MSNDVAVTVVTYPISVTVDITTNTALVDVAVNVTEQPVSVSVEIACLAGPQGDKGDTGEKGDIGHSWDEYTVTSWTEIDGSYYADVTHAAGKQFVPFQIFRTDTGETYDPEKVWCSAVNTISIQMPFEINLTVLVGA